MGTRSEYEKIKHVLKDESLCPFCKKENDKGLILWEGTYFFIVKNKYPYNGCQDHIMAIPYRHVTHTSDLSKEEFGDLKEVEIWMQDYYKGRFYFSFIRENAEAKSIPHLHYHFLPGELWAIDIENILKNQNIT